VDESLWDRTKTEALAVLQQLARARETITYSQFVKRVKATKLKYHGDERLERLLCEVSVDEDEAGRGLISALVVTLAAPPMPERGFFTLAAERGRIASSPHDLWQAERDAVWAAWSAG
jgi:hypothetical protein